MCIKYPVSLVKSTETYPSLTDTHCSPASLFLSLCVSLLFTSPVKCTRQRSLFIHSQCTCKQKHASCKFFVAEKQSHISRMFQPVLHSPVSELSRFTFLTWLFTDDTRCLITYRVERKSSSWNCALTDEKCNPLSRKIPSLTRIHLILLMYLMYIYHLTRVTCFSVNYVIST